MIKQEFDIEEKDQKKKWLRNFSLSILLHLFLIVILFYFFGFKNNRAKVNKNFFTLDTKEYIHQESDLVKEKVEKDEVEKPVLPNDSKQDKTEELKSLSFSDIIVDTTNLDQVYTEPSLNVSIKYPKGWTFIDQNKKKKLDGVTFWESEGQFNPPPYIHLEVVDKDMFIEKRYLYKLDLKNYIAYYNDPEKMQGYITQVFYIRTEDNEDYRLKLMIKGEVQFKLFQPRFWAILKSFSFGNSLF